MHCWSRLPSPCSATGGEPAVTVRSVCRESELNSRYFYESFAGTDELLGAVYDHVVTQLGEAVGAAMEAAGDERRARTRAGMRAVLAFSSGDPRRGRLLFTDARANSVLAERRSSTQEVLYETVILEDTRLHPDTDTVCGQGRRGAVHGRDDRAGVSVAARAASATDVDEVDRPRPEAGTRSTSRPAGLAWSRSSRPARRPPAATPARAGRGPSRRPRRSVRPR